MIPFLTPAEAAKAREPLFNDDFYDAWERRTRDRWAVEAFAWEQENKRRRRAKRDVFGFVSVILAVTFICIALFIGARS